MNKMDLNMMTQTAPDEDKPKGFWGTIKRIAIFAAPLVVIIGGGLLLALMIATGPKAKEKGEARTHRLCNSRWRTRARRQSQSTCKAKRVRALKPRWRRKLPAALFGRARNSLKADLSPKAK